jgi:hypothetical protein
VESWSETDWDIRDVTCEGTPAVKTTAAGDGTFIVKFNRQGLMSVSPGEAVNFTVKGTIYNSVREAQFEGTDTIRVQ